MDIGYLVMFPVLLMERGGYTARVYPEPKIPSHTINARLNMHIDMQLITKGNPF